MSVVLVLSGGCSDGQVNPYDSPPRVEILSPFNGDAYVVGDTMTLMGCVADDGGYQNLGLEWYDPSLDDSDESAEHGDIPAYLVAPSATCDEEAFDAEFSAEISITGAVTAFAVRATDAGGGQAEARVDISVSLDTPPTITYTSPTEGQVYPYGSPVHVIAEVEDPDEDDPTVIDLTWGGDIDTATDPPANPDATGTAELAIPDLDPGDYYVTLSATDAAGQGTTSVVTFSVIDADVDADGYDDEAYGGTDCDDGDAEVHPGAPELCDGVDDDCNGYTDEGVTGTYYGDGDGDGYGGTTTVEACSAPDGYAVDGGDCDDFDDAVNPGADEVCDGVDDDCDGDIDEGLTSTWYLDVDGDSYGGGTSTSACTAPVGYVATSADCDDGNAAVNPAAPESCDGVDDDCDGLADDADPDVVARSTWYADADGDGYGGGVGSTACSAPPGYVATSSDCDDGNPAVAPTAVETCDGIDDDCDGLVDDADSGVAGSSTWYTDGDGDGYGAGGGTTACTAPSGSVATNTDCDDEDEAVSPAATETCNGVDDDCDGLSDDADSGVVGRGTWYADSDGDGHGGTTTTAACVAPVGFVSSSDDCDDTTADAHPGGTEVCDGLDDDCDGSVDEGVTSSWYSDGDGDGYGGSRARADCTPPVGYVAFTGDCNDADGAVHPGATDVCDGVDNDCDGVTDTGDSRTFYADGDGDGYGGSTTLTATSCTTPTGYSTMLGDCDDGAGSVHPGATEVCDGLDEDCDGVVDEGVTTTWYADADSDGFGATTTTTACSAPAGYVGLTGDCDDLDSTANPDGTEVCDGADNDCDGDVDFGGGLWCAAEATTTVGGDAASARFGTSVAVVDIDNTGFADVLAGAAGDAANYGAAYVVPGWTGAKLLTRAGSTTVTTWSGVTRLGSAEYGSGVGYAVGSAGDFNADGFDDFLVAGWYDDTTGGTDSGAVYLVRGLTGTTETLSATTALEIDGAFAYENLGVGLAYGDIDGDGTKDDVILGAPEDTGAVAHDGRVGHVYVLFGDAALSGSLGAATIASGGHGLEFDGTGAGGQAGYSVAAGDFDGGGMDDVAIGAPGLADSSGHFTGGVYAISSESRGGTTTQSLAAGADVAVFTGDGTASFDTLGTALAAGDINDDGYSDLAIGDQYAAGGGTDSGEVCVVYGYGYSDLASWGGVAPRVCDVRLLGGAAYDYAGTSVQMADLDGDGRDEVLMGAPYDDTAGADAGAVYAYLSDTLAGDLSAADADLAIYGDSAGDHLGWYNTIAVGDTNGDTVADLVLGAPYAAWSGSSDVGVVYVFDGSVLPWR